MIPFALALHRALTTDPRVNLCWSPYAVACAVRHLATHARGRSGDELAAVVGDAATLAEAGELAPAPARPELAVSATLWADPVLDITGRPAPFLADPDKTRDMINQDVATTTRGLVPELVDALPADAVAALVVALYLRCGWVVEFERAETAPRRFRTPDGKKQVPTMRLRAEVGYARTEDWQVVRLDAWGGVHATVLLPYGDLATIEPALTPRTLAELLAAPARTHVDLSLPAFTVSTRAELRDVDVAGVRIGELAGDLPLDSVPHQAVLTVDERGIQGAAATAAIAVMSGATREPVEVRVDRPFLFVVTHAQTGVVYFLTRVTDPVT